MPCAGVARKKGCKLNLRCLGLPVLDSLYTSGVNGFRLLTDSCLTISRILSYGDVSFYQRLRCQRLARILNAGSMTHHGGCRKCLWTGALRRPPLACKSALGPGRPPKGLQLLQLGAARSRPFRLPQGPQAGRPRVLRKGSSGKTSAMSHVNLRRGRAFGYASERSHKEILKS